MQNVEAAWKIDGPDGPEGEGGELEMTNAYVSGGTIVNHGLIRGSGEIAAHVIDYGRIECIPPGLVFSGGLVHEEGGTETGSCLDE